MECAQVQGWTAPAPGHGWAQRPSAAAGLAFVALAAAFGLGVWTGGRGDDRLSALEEEVGDLHPLVAVSMLGQRSAAERLKGVTLSSELTRPTPQVVSALLDTLRYDTNPNVRLAAVGVLAGFGDDASVRTGVVEALGHPQSPMAQIALIDFLVDFRERNSMDALERLAGDETVRPEVREHAAWAVAELR